MNKIIKGRGEGKTTELIIRSHQTNYPILVHSRHLVNIIQTKATVMGYQIPKPITVADFNLVQLRGRKMKVLIDEADFVLQQVLNGLCRAKGISEIEIDSITLSPNEEEIEHEKLRKAAQPLVDYIRENYDPHTTVLVENDFVRVVRDDLGVPFKI